MFYKAMGCFCFVVQTVIRHVMQHAGQQAVSVMQMCRILAILSLH